MDRWFWRKAEGRTDWKGDAEEPDEQEEPDEPEDSDDSDPVSAAFSRANRKVSDWQEEIENARLKIAEILLNHGSVNRPMSNNMTPLHHAVKELDVPYVKLLLKRGANVEIKNNMAQTPLMLLRRRRRLSYRSQDKEFFEIESILLKHYAKRNTKQRLVDQMGPPNMKDLQETAELPRGSRIKAEPDDYPFFYEESSYPLRDDGDGIIRKNIKSYLGGNKTRNLLKYEIKESVFS